MLDSPGYVQPPRRGCLVLAADMFSEGASFARVVQFAVDGAFEVDTQLLAGLSDAVFVRHA